MPVYAGFGSYFNCLGFAWQVVPGIGDVTFPAMFQGCLSYLFGDPAYGAGVYFNTYLKKSWHAIMNCNLL